MLGSCCADQVPRKQQQQQATITVGKRQTPSESVEEENAGCRTCKLERVPFDDKLAPRAGRYSWRERINHDRTSGGEQATRRETSNNKLARASSANVDGQRERHKKEAELLGQEAGGGSNRANGGQPPTSGRERGLLKALLGERCKSWLEQRTVILDIRNGKKQQQQQQQPDRPQPAKEEDSQRTKSAEHHQSNTKLANFKLDDAIGQQQQQQQEEDIEGSQLKQQETKEQQRRPIVCAITSERAHNELRLPTFGSVPQRLTRLPYYSYQGHAKNINLSSVAERQAYLNRRKRASSLASLKTLDSSGSSPSSSSSSSSSPSSANSKTSGQFRVAATSSSSSPANNKLTRCNLEQTKAKREYSNISNIFPTKSTNKTLAQKNRPQSSVSDSVTQRQTTRQAQEQDKCLSQELNLSNRTRSHSTNRLHLSKRKNLLANSTADLTVQKASGNNQQQTLKKQFDNDRRQDNTSKAMYATTNRSRAHVPGTNSAMGESRRSSVTNLPRRPLSSSAHHSMVRSPSYARSGGGMQARAASHSRFDSLYGSTTPIDPDCPVHGDDHVRSSTGTMARQRYGPTREPTIARSASAAGRRALEHAVSQPELLYDGDEMVDARPFYGTQDGAPADDDDYQNLNWQRHQADSGLGHLYEHRRPAYNNKSPLVSPGGDVYLRSNQRPGSKLSRQQQAYYNASSRFSLYHPTSEGVQSSLAPTSEQLRRILGHRPPLSGTRPVHLHPQWAYTRPFIHLQPASSRRRSSASPPLGDQDVELLDDRSDSELDGPRFWPFNRLQDTQAIRAVDFHPSGEVYAIGSNSRALRICAYPAEHELRRFNPLSTARNADQGTNDAQRDEPTTTRTGDQDEYMSPKAPHVLFKFLQVHRGSIYCVAFNSGGQLLATGSNDQTVHLVRYNSITHNPDGDEFRLSMHNGTVRDLCFIDDSFGSSNSLLLSAGGGDNKIYVTDCDTVTPYQSMAGHTQMVMGLDHCGGAQFVSGSYDKTIRFWDLRTRSCTSIVSAPAPGGGGGAGAPVSSLSVDPSGRLLATGHTDSTCMLYDIRGAKIIQAFRPHDDEIRSISFSFKSYYLLTGSYDGRLIVSDLQGDLTRPLPSACVAQCQDKIVQAKWHPSDFTFVSTSADKSATLWTLPG